MGATAIRQLHQAAHVVAFAIGKGGAGKTSLTANIAALLAENGYRVLVCVLDPQDNLGEDLGYTFAGGSDAGAALSAAILTGQALQVPLIGVRPGLDVISSGPMAGEPLSVHITNQDVPDDALAAALLPLAGDYDFILIDCPPFSRTLQRQAFAAARWLIVPSQADASSRKGIAELAGEYLAAQQVNPDLTFLGVVLFDVSTAEGPASVKTRVRKELDAELEGFSRVLTATIRSAKAPAEAARRRGVTMAELSRDYVPSWKIAAGLVKGNGVPKSAGSVAADYEALTAEILDVIAEGASS